MVFLSRYDYVTFNTKYLLKYFLFRLVKKTNATYLSMLCKQRDHGTLPPSSKIMPKHDEYLGGIGDKYIGR